MAQEQKQKEMEELNKALADLGLELDKQDAAGYPPCLHIVISSIDMDAMLCKSIRGVAR